ncbi:alanine--tRNA ligase [Patescibacteria group bacterium]|nr:alanine--tRNA ligase [Patescibacteria group bacterium]MBU1705389.1 alanine--tRNA ligase [Patescibacteria group bacterium]
MKSSDIRQKFLEYFQQKDHVIIPSASLIPENDPSVLFTTAGMHPLVPFLLGEDHPEGHRLADAQKCLRTGDIDEVGDKTHLTFFEMLGNWSLGDYFKAEAIAMSYELLTDPNWFGLDPAKLAVSVFAGDETTPKDEESANLWRAQGLPGQRIAFLDKQENWWPAGGKHPGPQGPDTEIFYWTGAGEAPEKFDPEDKNWVEIWNNVFMQYNLSAGGGLLPLAQKNVDTGMGLERMAAVLQGKDNVYDTDLFEPIIKEIEKLSGQVYDSQSKAGYSFRVIADHLRTAVFVLGDPQGVCPSNVDQGYVLRRLIRRAIRHAKNLMPNQDLSSVINVIIQKYQAVYPELKQNQNRILTEFAQEQNKFKNTLEKGIREFNKIYQKVGQVSGQDAFVLYSSYGFPIELTEELAKEQGQEVDRETFAQEFTKHQELSRAGAGEKFAGGLADHSEETVKLHTATHLLHQALRQVLGDHVEQKGSNITTQRLRFDFSHPAKMTDQEKQETQQIVNDVIELDLPVRFEIMDFTEAQKRGAIGLFEDKYEKMGGKVKVYFIGDKEYFSTEVCGGPHVEHTGQLGTFQIQKEEASSAGIRRIKATLT